MPSYRFARRLTQKPPRGQAVLLPGHPLARGLVAVYLFNECGGSPSNLLTGRKTTFTGTTLPVWAGSPFGGAALIFPGGAALSGYCDAANESLPALSPSDFSWAAGLRWTGAAGAAGGIADRHTSLSNGGWWIGKGAAEDIGIEVGFNTSNLIMTFGPIPLGVWGVAVVARQVQGLAVAGNGYWNGVSLPAATATPGSGSQATSDDGEVLKIGTSETSANTFTTNWAGEIAWLYLWNRALTAGEAKALSAEPFSMFMAQG